MEGDMTVYGYARVPETDAIIVDRLVAESSSL